MHLAIDNLSVEFMSKEGSRVPALDSLSCQIESGTFVTLLGPSGCGKSTLIRVLAGLQAATRGAVFADATNITAPHPKIALMFQEATLMPWRTVQDNIALPLELAGVSKAERYQAVDELLPALGLSDFAKAYPTELSGGMAQRAALGRVLIQRPAVLLLDEPFGSLDALTRDKIILDLLHLWKQYRPTVLMVTHDINEAVLLADRVLVMSRRPGRIIEDLLVPLDPHRSLNMLYTEDFVVTAKRIRQVIDEA